MESQPENAALHIAELLWKVSLKMLNYTLLNYFLFI